MNHLKHNLSRNSGALTEGKFYSDELKSEGLNEKLALGTWTLGTTSGIGGRQTTKKT
jgi:hypothetical protein